MKEDVQMALNIIGFIIGVITQWYFDWIGRLYRWLKKERKRNTMK